MRILLKSYKYINLFINKANELFVWAFDACFFFFMFMRVFEQIGGSGFASDKSQERNACYFDARISYITWPLFGNSYYTQTTTKHIKVFSKLYNTENVCCIYRSQNSIFQRERAIVRGKSEAKKNRKTTTLFGNIVSILLIVM